MSMKYKIHIADNATELSKLVNADLADGWKLHGDFKISDGMAGGFYQAMTKESKQPKTYETPDFVGGFLPRRLEEG